MYVIRLDRRLLQAIQSSCAAGAISEQVVQNGCRRPLNPGLGDVHDVSGPCTCAKPSVHRRRCRDGDDHILADELPPFSYRRSISHLTPHFEEERMAFHAGGGPNTRTALRPPKANEFDIAWATFMVRPTFGT